MKKNKIFGIINGPLVVIISGILLNLSFQNGFLPFTLEGKHIVNIPLISSFSEFRQLFVFPDFSRITDVQVILTAFVIAVVASLETLLCVEATDRLDPQKRITPVNRELKAQGLGNIVSGLIGGLPLTQVIVRSSSNITFGGKTRLSAILHGFFILFSVLLIPGLLNLIPLASLAAILLVVGYKLSHPDIFRKIYHLGSEQFVPFIATIAGILFTDLLKGIAIGMVFGIVYILKNNLMNPFVTDRELENHEHLLQLAEEMSFLNKASLIKILNEIPDNVTLTIDASRSRSIHPDILEIIEDFKINAQSRNVTLKLKGNKLDALEK